MDLQHTRLKLEVLYQERKLVLAEMSYYSYDGASPLMLIYLSGILSSTQQAINELEDILKGPTDGKAKDTTD